MAGHGRQLNHSHLALQCGQSKLHTMISQKWGIFVSSMVVGPCTLQGSPEKLLLSAWVPDKASQL